MLWEFGFSKDITHLKKGSDNGTQNIIDPYNVFLAPVEFFNAGSEYAAFFSGNNLNAPDEVTRQNHFQVDASYRVGITDTFNLGIKSGYFSGNGVHQFDIKDQADRYILFKPYYFIDFISDWNLTTDSLISFNFHFVPQYKTKIISSAHPEEFHNDNRYMQAVISFKKLF